MISLRVNPLPVCCFFSLLACLKIALVSAGSPARTSFPPSNPILAVRLNPPVLARGRLASGATHAPEHAPAPAPLLGVATVPRAKRVRATDRVASRKRPKQAAEPPAETEDEIEDESSLVFDPSGLLHVIVLNDPQGGPDDTGQSLLHAQDSSLEGCRPWVVSSQRREVVMQDAMTADALYAKAGVLDESKPIGRNLHTDVFKAVAWFLKPGEAAYWQEYGQLLWQIEWLEMRSSGRPEITDIS